MRAMTKTPQELAREVMEYCENAGYTVRDVIELDLAINRSIREMERVIEHTTKFKLLGGKL